ncbi:hypothetical protein ACLOJK_023883 [Asimina triloba]
MGTAVDAAVAGVTIASRGIAGGDEDTIVGDELDGLRSRWIRDRGLTADLLGLVVQYVAIGAFASNHVEEDGVVFGCMTAMDDEDDRGIGLITSSSCFHPN